MTHIIAMAGIHGCMPNVCEVYESVGDAVEAMADLHELGRDRTRKLRRDCYLELNCARDGNEYIEITACECDTPGDHTESGEWPE
jgi:hypothetical protein